MAIECAYSFTDLFLAAHKVAPSEAELQALYDLSQDERNEVVKQWAEQAGWQTRQRTGSDGKDYLAFAPKFGE